ncbi:MAG: protein kinase, partial [Proteobacteria bacterium]|nr:protein kinase [Pseudomonadota bacterium]
MSKPLDDIFSALLQQDFNNSLIDIIAEVNRNTEKAAMFNKMLNEAIAKENFDAFSVAIDKLYQQKFNDKGTDKELKLQIDRDFRKILIHSNILNSIFDKMVEKKNAAKVQQEAPVPFSPIPQPSVINRDFNDFIARLQQSKLEAPGEAFSKLVSPLARDQILNFFLIRHDPSTRANLSSEQYDKINKILAEIETLKPGEMLRLDKKETTLPRTLNILRGEDGEYKLIVETKSRLSDDTKQVLPKIAGTTKSGKPAWRIDGDEMEYFSLVASLDYDEKEIQRQIARGYTREEVLAMFREEDVGKLKVEVDISKETKGEQVQENILGKQYTNKGKTKITVYSVKAKGSLELLTKHSVSSKLSDQQKDTLILELLQGIKVFHDKGYVHQDLKPGNILIYGDDTNGYHLKLTDFGLTRKHGDISEEGLSTSAYHSPETAYYYLSDTDSSKYNYYNGPYSKATLANQLYHYNPQLFPADGSKRAQVRTPDFANDMWAAGVIIFQIRYGRLPNINDMPLINQDPLLSKLLTPDRSQRFNIASALALQQMIQPLVGDKTFQKYSTTFQNTEVGKKFWEIFKMGAIVNGKFALTKDLEHAILYNLDPQTKNNLTILEKIQLAKDLKEVFSKQPGANETDINEALDTCVLRATSALHAEYKQKGIPIPPSLAQNQKKPYRDPVPKVSTKQKILKLDPNRFVEKVGKAKGDIFAQREHKKIDRDRDMVISSSRREATLVSPKAMFELQRMRTAYINNANLYDVAKLPPSPLLAAAQEIINDARIKQVSKKSDPKKLPDQSERMLNDVFITTDSPLGIQLGLKYPVMIGKNGQMIAIMETDQQKLGQGAFGQVFLGMDLDSGKLVAVKYQTPQTDAKRKEVMEERDKLENLNRLI